MKWRVPKRDPVAEYPLNQPRRAALVVRPGADALTLVLSGRLDAHIASGIWNQTLDALAYHKPAKLIVDASELTHADGPGLGLLLKLELEQYKRGGTATFAGLSPRLERVLALVDVKRLSVPYSPGRERRGMAEMVGRAAEKLMVGIADQLAYVGEVFLTLVQCALRPSLIRGKDLWLTSIAVGVESLPILLLVGFLIGLILSFQSAMSLQRFGAEIWVPNMLGLAMFREMGPLITAILLTSRSGSAFAAELGTMKVNEEVDALTTMGLSPVRFLVAPKIIAAVLMAPIMTMFFCFSGLIGGAVVMLSLGFPLSTFTDRVFSSTEYTDFFGGVAKIFVFSVLVAAVGCQRGLSAKSGAGSVGRSTTSAVVAGLVLITIADGMFAVVYYVLGW